MSETIVILLFTGLLVFMIGIYLLFAYCNLLRLIVGVEVMAKGITLVLLAAGIVRRDIGFIQSLVVTFIIVETILAAMMLGLVFIVHRIYNSLDVKLLSKLKG